MKKTLSFSRSPVSFLKFLVILLSIRGSYTVYAKPKKTLPEDMHETANLILALQKYSANTATFNDEKNKKEIARILQALANQSDKITKHAEVKTPAYRLSGEALTKHLKELNQLYLNGNRIYAKWMANSTPMICASCHSQLPDSAAHVWKVNEKSLPRSPLERADFLFSTWKYDEALALYNDILRKYPLPQALERTELDRAINKKLTIFLRVKRNIVGAISSFKLDLANKALPEPIAKTLGHWLISLEKLKPQQKTLDNYKNPEQLFQFASNTQSQPYNLELNAPERIYASGLLYEALHSHPSDKNTPILLYWLGAGDNDVNRDFFFGLSQSYLRECVVKYPKHPIAKKCFADYALEERAQWSGSRGYDPPPGLEEDLRNLEKKVSEQNGK